MRRTPLTRRTPLKSDTRIDTHAKRRAISPASEAQRAKVRGAVCRSCGADHSTPAHCVDRSLGGCDSVLCVIPLCVVCHRAYDLHELDVLPLLSREEQAHAAGHLGLIGALERTTNVGWQEKAA